MYICLSGVDDDGKLHEEDDDGVDATAGLVDVDDDDDDDAACHCNLQNVFNYKNCLSCFCLNKFNFVVSWFNSQSTLNKKMNSKILVNCFLSKSQFLLFSVCLMDLFANL